MLNVTEALKEGEVAVRGPFEGLDKKALVDLCRGNDLLVGGTKKDLRTRLIAAGVQE